MSHNKFAVVELNDGTITSISMNKFLPSQMKIIEECDNDRITEKTAYWNRIYHPQPEQPNQLKYHYYNSKRNIHLWSIHSDKSKIKGIRHKKEFELINNETKT